MPDLKLWAAVRFNEQDSREWVDVETLSSLPEVARHVAAGNDASLPLFFKVHPVVRIAQFDCVEVKQGSGA